MLVLLVIPACGTPESDDTSTCPTVESPWGCITVHEASVTCPDPATLAPSELDDPWDCSETIIAIGSEDAPAANTCSYLLNCDWQCCYDVTVEHCTQEVCPEI